jgi:hypothetical protein
MLEYFARLALEDFRWAGWGQSGWNIQEPNQGVGDNIGLVPRPLSVGIQTPAPDPVENSNPCQVFLPSESFKGILRIPMAAGTLVRRRNQARPGGQWCQAQNGRICAGKFPPPALNRLWFRRDKPYEPIVERELCSLGRSSGR